MFFPGFALHTTTVPGGTLRYRTGGTGPALLLLHGNPQAHAMWHLVAPALAHRFTIVCPDLRGYDGSEKPPATPDHALYAKTEMARNIADLMTELGREIFAFGAHDRGARVAQRPFPRRASAGRGDRAVRGFLPTDPRLPTIARDAHHAIFCGRPAGDCL